MSGHLEPARARMAALGAAAGEAFDPLGRAFVVTLIARAEAESEGAQAILARRIEARLDALEAAYRAARTAAEGALATLVDAGIAAPEALAEALGQGDFVAVKRGVRRLLASRKEGRPPARVPWIARLRGEARAREIALPDEVTRGLDEISCEGGTVERSALRRAQELGSAVSSALFRESAEHARAELAVARAADNLPDGAGPYNGQVLAARALAAMAALSPTYVRALIAGLDDLAAIEALFQPEDRKTARPSKPKRPKKKQGGAAAA